MLHRLEIATGQSAYSITHFSHPCFWRDKQKDLRAIVITHGHDTSSLARIQSTSADTPAEIPTATRPPSSRYSILTNTYTPQLNTHVLVSLSSTFSDIDCLLLGNRSDQQYGRSQHPKHPSIPASSTGIKMASFLQRLGLDASAKTLHLNNPCPPLTSRPDCPNLVPARSVTTRLVDRIRTKLQRHSSVRPAASEEVAASIIRSSPQSFLASSSCLLRSSNTIYCSLGRFEASQKGKDV
ncbi:hypothetical protein BX666DRAFT_343687 [Dichotomocladium elegans]|nr:hypothetical protein BX666DRAFT_343687 [Dichotomocladium elegans]